MNTRIVLTQAATLSILLFFHFGAAASLGEEAINGRIRSSGNDHVRVCFDHDAATSAGQEFDVVRHNIRTSPKGPAIMESTQTGIIRIDSIDADGCANATLVRGSAQVLDWVATRAKP